MSSSCLTPSIIQKKFTSICNMRDYLIEGVMKICVSTDHRDERCRFGLLPVRSAEVLKNLRTRLLAPAKNEAKRLDIHRCWGPLQHLVYGLNLGIGHRLIEKRLGSVGFCKQL